MFIDSKSFQRTKILLLWPCNKIICLIKQFMFFGLRTYCADTWGQCSRFLRQNVCAMDSEQFDCQPPAMLGPTPIFALRNFPHQCCLHQKMRLPEALVLSLHVHSHHKATELLPKATQLRRTRMAFKNLTPLRIRFKHNPWKSSGFKWSVATTIWYLRYNGNLLWLLHL